MLDAKSLSTILMIVKGHSLKMRDAIKSPSKWALQKKFFFLFHQLSTPDCEKNVSKNETDTLKPRKKGKKDKKIKIILNELLQKNAH